MIECNTYIRYDAAIYGSRELEAGQRAGERVQKQWPSILSCGC